MFKNVLAAATALLLATGAASALTLNETEAGEFGDSYTTPTDFTGYNVIVGQSDGLDDFEYFKFDSFLPGAKKLIFTLNNAGTGSNMLIRLSATPFTMPEWDWTIDELDKHKMSQRELYANQWAPSDTYKFVLPKSLDGPLYGFAHFYGSTSPSTFTISQFGAQQIYDIETAAAVPLPGALALMLSGLGALAFLRRKTV